MPSEAFWEDFWRNPPKALIFDCDGTLADTMPAHFEAWQDALRPFDLAFPEKLFYELGGVPTVKIAAQLFDESKTGLAPEVLAERKEKLYLEHVSLIKPIGQVVEQARRAYEAGIPMAVASGGTREVVTANLKQLGIAHWFGATVCAEDCRQHKPHPEVFQRAASSLGIVPEQCVAFEDADPGVASAKAASMRVIDVRNLENL